MAEIPQGFLKALTDGINAITASGRAAAKEVILDALSRYDMPIDAAEEIVSILEPFTAAVADDAAALSAEAYDFIRSASIDEALGAQSYPAHSSEALERAVYGMANMHPNNMAAFVTDLLDRIDYEAKRAAGNTTVENAARDKAKPRYARVPVGPETCPFCIMLASRGAVYHSEASAGKFNHYHPNCDCRVVPVFDYITVGSGPDTRRIPATEIEGYDPDAYYDQYLDDLASGALKVRPKVGARASSERAQSYLPTKVLTRDWGGYSGVRDYLGRAKDVLDLDERYKEVMGSFSQSDYVEGARHDLQNVVGEVVHIARRALDEVKRRQEAK